MRALPTARKVGPPHYSTAHPKPAGTILLGCNALDALTDVIRHLFYLALLSRRLDHLHIIKDMTNRDFEFYVAIELNLQTE